MKQPYFDLPVSEGERGIQEDELEGYNALVNPETVQGHHELQHESEWHTDTEESEMIYEDDEAVTDPDVTGPKPLPEKNPIAFARLPVSGSYWPIISSNKYVRLVSYRRKDGKYTGNPGRSFLAGRDGGNRYHAGIDLYSDHKDYIIACEDGVIRNFYHFYRSTYCLIIEHGNLVINYGEVDKDSLKVNNLKVGDPIKAGQVIGLTGKMFHSSMLHFETYTKGTRSNQRFKPGQTPPKELLNPTLYLLSLQKYGLQGNIGGAKSQLSSPNIPGQKNWSEAIQQNRAYAAKLGWERSHMDINDLLLRVTGQSGISLGEEAFAEAVSQFQRLQGFSVKDQDGIIGPNTWKVMQPLLQSVNREYEEADASVENLEPGYAEDELTGEDVADEGYLTDETINYKDETDSARDNLDQEAYEDQFDELIISHEFDVSADRGSTVYIDVSAVENRRLKTGVFIPAGFRKTDKADIILYFHGLYGYGNKTSGIEYYWKNYSNIRSCFLDSRRNAILIAPTLTSDPQQRSILLGRKDGFDHYVNDCFRELKARQCLDQSALPGRIILAGHSAGGSVLRRILGSHNQYVSGVIEVWGFDCLYNYSWESLKLNIPFYHYWAFNLKGAKSSPGVKGDSLQKKNSNFRNIAPKKPVYHRGIIEHAWLNEINGRDWFDKVAH